MNRTCPVCQTDFAPTHHSQRFCPPPAGKAKSRCAKAYENATQRGTLDQLLARAAVAAPFDCAWCGTHCVPGQDDIDQRASRFCTVAHKKAWHRAHGSRRAARRAKAERKLARAARGRGPSGVLYMGYCFEDGTPYVTRTPPTDLTGYCSRACVRRQGKRRRRARLLGATLVGHVSFRDMARRDDWMCKLCDEPIDRDAEVPHPRSATMDHIVPLCDGGSHTMDNVQLAHFICNARKGDADGARVLELLAAA